MGDGASSGEVRSALGDGCLILLGPRLVVFGRIGEREKHRVVLVDIRRRIGT